MFHYLYMRKWKIDLYFPKISQFFYQSFSETKIETPRLLGLVRM